MANDMTFPVRAGSVQRSRLMDKLRGVNDALASGVAISFPILSIGPGQWTVRWKGEERIVTVPGHDDINQPFIDVIFLDVQKDMSRVYYKQAFGNQRNRPDCWSSNGVRPDAEVPVPVNPVCGTCPNSAWGSGASPAAPKAQACQQRRRTVVVPYGDDLTNEEGGGPMLLSVPPGSLTNQAKYKETLDEAEDVVDGEVVKGVPFCGVITRLSFEQKDQKGNKIKYPKIKFDLLRQSDGRPYYLNDAEVETVLTLRESETVKRILTSKTSVNGTEADPEGGGGGGGGAGEPTPPQRAPSPVATAPKASPKEPPKEPDAQVSYVEPTPKPKPVGGHPVSPITEAVNAPAAPPPSARAVNTAPVKVQLRSVPPAPVDDGETEAQAPLPGKAGSVFDALMARPTRS